MMNRQIELKLPLLTSSHPKVVQEVKTTKTNQKINLDQIIEPGYSNSKKKINFSSECSLIQKQDTSNYKANDSTLLSNLTQQNIHQSIKNIYDQKFLNKASLYQHRFHNRSFSQSQLGIDQLMKEFDDFRNLKIYENIEEKDYSVVFNKSDDKRIKNIKEKYQKYFQFVDKVNADNENQFSYMQNNINLQQLLCSEIFRQLEMMPGAQNGLFEKHYQYELSNMKIIQQLIKEQLELKQENKELKRQLEHESQQNVENMEQIKNYSFSYDEKLQKEFQSRFKDIKDQILFENQRLKKEIKALNELVKQMDYDEISSKIKRQVDQVKKDCEKQIKVYQNKLKNADSTYMIQKNMLISVKTKLNKSISECQYLKNDNNILRIKMKDFQANFNVDDFTIFRRETVQIQREDLFLKEELILNLRAELKKVYESHLKLQSRYDSFIQQEQKIIVDKEKFSDQQEVLKDLKFNLSEDLRLQKNIYSQFSNPNKDQIIRNLNLLQQMGNQIYEEVKVQFEGADVNQHNDNQRNRYQLYRLYKPSFNYFLDASVKEVEIDEVVQKVDQNPKWLIFVKIRAIFDSKFNEIMANNISNDQCINISKFPEFVYSWISNFTVDLEQREITSLDLRENKVEDIRIEFLFELMLKKYQKLWEIMNFKNFLSEKYELDELYFYLQIRYLIFNGPQLSINKSKFDYIHFIDEEKVKEIVARVLNKHSFEQRQFVINKVKEKGYTKGKRLMVDIQFLLSVFLEYYRTEKKIKSKIIRDIFLSFQNSSLNKEYSISFDNFMSMMEWNFNTIPIVERVSIYRDCWNVGNGKIGPEIFMAVCQERNLFIKQMNIANMVELPIQLDLDSNISRKNQNTQLHYQAYQLIQSNIGYFQNMESQIECLGMEQLLYDFVECYDILANKFQKSSFEIRDKSVFQIVFRLLNKILQFQNIQYLNRKYVENQEEMPVIKIAADFVAQIVELNKQQQKQSKLLKIRNNLKLIRFQIFSKKQILKFYGELYDIINKHQKKKKKTQIPQDQKV